MFSRLTLLQYSFALFSILFVLCSLSPANASNKEKFVVLGDSIEAGIIFDTPEIDAIYAENRHTDIFHDYLVDYVDEDFRQINLAVPGATLNDIVKKQLFKAMLAVLIAKDPVVFIGGGGNDLRAFLNSPDSAPCLAGDLPTCLALVDEVLDRAENRIEKILKGIKLVSFNDNPIILIRTQYNPFLKAGCDPLGGQIGQLGNLALEGTGGPTDPIVGLNNRIRALAAEYDAVVVETFLPFAFQPDVLVSDDCVHPTETGHDVIGQITINTYEAVTP